MWASNILCNTRLDWSGMYWLQRFKSSVVKLNTVRNGGPLLFSSTVTVSIWQVLLRGVCVSPWHCRQKGHKPNKKFLASTLASTLSSNNRKAQWEEERHYRRERDRHRHGSDSDSPPHHHRSRSSRSSRDGERDSPRHRKRSHRHRLRDEEGDSPPHRRNSSHHHRSKNSRDEERGSPHRNSSHHHRSRSSKDGRRESSHRNSSHHRSRRNRDEESWWLRAS